MSVTGKALWYIESHLSGDVSLEAIADVVGVSRFHLSRAFGVTVGHALASYVRARRLSQAARTLAGGAPDILSVALDAGYGSHEAFTRAFRQHFGLTPEELRERAHVGDLDLLEPIRMHETKSVALPTPRVVSSDALLIFGLGQRYHGTNAGIPSQWEKFLPYVGHITGQVGQERYGVICNTDDAGSIDYICGVQVREFPSQPAEFTRLRIPPQTYAVFEHQRPRVRDIDHVAGDLELRPVERGPPGERRTRVRALRRTIRRTYGTGRPRNLDSDRRQIDRG